MPPVNITASGNSWTFPEEFDLSIWSYNIMVKGGIYTFTIPTSHADLDMSHMWSAPPRGIARNCYKLILIYLSVYLLNSKKKVVWQL